VRIDINARSCNVLLPDAEIEARKAALVPLAVESQTPWQELYRAHVGGLDSGAVLEFAVKYRGVARKTPRHNH
jgi:dihydroxy-acid dehydratase